MIVQFSHQALKQLKKLDHKLHSDILRVLDEFSRNQPTDYKKLKGFPSRYRVREYRAVFDIIIQDHMIYVLRIAHRSEVYKGIENL